MLKQNKGKILALDVGTRRTGVAITDEDKIIVFSRPEIHHTSTEELFSQLREFIAGENIEKIIVGKPLNLKGEQSSQTKYTEEIADKIKMEFSIEAVMMDERLSTHQAGKFNKEEKYLDSIAAKILLETYLSSKA